MISLEYLIIFTAEISIILLVFSGIIQFYYGLKEKVIEYNKKQIIYLLDLNCKKKKLLNFRSKINVFSYSNFTYSNSCGTYFIKKGDNYI